MHIAARETQAQLLLPSSSHQASTSSNLTQPFATDELDGFWKNRVSSVGTSAPVCIFMRANETLRNETTGSFQLMEALNEAFLKKRQQPTDNCNLPNQHIWAGSARTRPMGFQIGQMDDTCYSYIHLNDAVKEEKFNASLLNHAQQIIRSGRRALTTATQNNQFPKDGGWGTGRGTGAPFENVYKNLTVAGQTCTVDTAFAYIINSRVYLRVLVSNRHSSYAAAVFERQLVIEFVPKDFSDSLRMIHPRYDPNLPPDNQTGPLENSSTVMYATQNRIPLSTKQSLDEDSFSALTQGSGEVKEATDRAEDALTYSNIALLVLPMVMNLIPVAFVADLATTGITAYIVFTDVLSCIPFMLKGIELVMLSAPRKAYVTAFFAGNETFAQIEVWCAKCQALDVYVNTGIVFIVTGIVAMLVGFGLEFWATRYIRKRKRMASYGNQVPGIFGVAARAKTRFGVLGSGTFEEERAILSRLTNESQNDIKRSAVADKRL